MTINEWAKKEVEISCKKENPNWDGEKFDYGCCCYKSALKAYESLINDGHSGASFEIEKNTEEAIKKLAPTRLIKNEFYQQVKQLEDDGADAETMKQLLGKGRAKQGMFEGDLDNGELEIGQVASMLTHPETVEAIFNDILQDYRESLLRMNHQTL